MTSQLPKVKINGNTYFVDARLKEFKNTIFPFTLRSFKEIKASSSKIELITLRRTENLGRMISCINMNELNELSKMNLDKKSKAKLKKAGVCWDD